MTTEFITGTGHYNKVLSKVASVRKALWIGSADIKDLHMKVSNSTQPFLAVLTQQLKRGIDIRLIHAKETWSGISQRLRQTPDFGKKSGKIIMSPRSFQNVVI